MYYTHTHTHTHMKLCHFALYLKLKHHCKWTIFQLKIILKDIKITYKIRYYSSFNIFLALPYFGIGMKTDLFLSCGLCGFPKFNDIFSAAL